MTETQCTGRSGALMIIAGIAAGTVVACQLVGLPVQAADYGAVGNGATDCTAALQAAMDESARTGGGTVHVGTGRYVVTGPLRVPPGVTLKGQWQGPHFSTLAAGTVIEVRFGAGQEDGPPVFMLEESATLAGLTIFYPEQRADDVQPYPWTVQGRGTHLNVMDCTFVNPYKAIDFATYGHEMHYIRNVYGCPLRIGVSLDKCTDIGRVENVHFNPNAWTRSGAENAPHFGEGGTGRQLVAYMQANLIAFEIGRSDWEMMVHTFSWGAHIGYRFYASTDGPTNGSFLGIAADWAVRPLVIEASQGPGLLITNGEFVGSPTCEAVVDILAGNEGTVQLANSSFWGPHDRVIRSAGRGPLSLSQCNFVQWGRSGPDIPAVEVLAGSLLMQGCVFLQDRAQVRLGEGCAGAAIIGCQTPGPMRIANETEAQVELVGNIVVPRG